MTSDIIRAMTRHKKISLVIPAYNEQEVLQHLYERLTKLAGETPNYDFEFLFVNDGSRDRTLEIIQGYAEKDLKIAYINLSRNFGKETAMIAGLDHVTGDATVIIDADLQDPPELIPKMIELWEEGYDDVFARRNSRAGETWLKKATSTAFYRILQSSTPIPIQRDTGDFRLLDKRCVEALREMRESQRYTKGMFSWIGYKKKEITYDRDPRAAGETKWNYLKLVDLAIEGIVSFTTAPLRWSTIAGGIVSFLAFIYIMLRRRSGAWYWFAVASVGINVLFQIVFDLNFGRIPIAVDSIVSAVFTVPYMVAVSALGISRSGLD